MHPYLLFSYMHLKERAMEEMTMNSHFPISTVKLQFKYEHNQAYVSRITESHNHRTVEVEQDLWSHLIQPRAQEGTPRAGCPGPHSGGF